MNSESHLVIVRTPNFPRPAFIGCVIGDYMHQLPVRMHIIPSGQEVRTPTLEALLLQWWAAHQKVGEQRDGV